MQKNKVLELLNESVNAFSCRGEVVEIYSFGSVSNKHADKYSDVDLTVVTNDIKKTTKDLARVLSGIDKVITIFTLAEGEGSVAYTIFFQNYSLYQKLDLGIISNGNTQLFANSRLKFKNDKPTEYISSKFVSRLESEQDHAALDCVIGSLRYLKFIRRNEIWPAYKFYKSFIEQYLKLRLNIELTESFTLEHFKAIQGLNENKLTELIFNKSEVDISNTYLHYLNKYYTLSKDKISNENKMFIENVITFWVQEIKDIYK